MSLLFFDIETAPNENKQELYVKLQREREEQGKKPYPDMALIPEFCRITAIAWALDDKEVDVRLMNSVDIHAVAWRNAGVDSVMSWSGREKVSIESFLREINALNPPKLVGFNIVNFDLPVIYTRGAALDVRPDRVLDLRPWGNDVIDLYEKRKWSASPGGLKPTCRALGLADDLWQNDESGDKAQDMSDDELRKYVADDVIATRRLYHFYKGWWF